MSTELDHTKITLTADHIAESRNRLQSWSAARPWNCPVALACQDAGLDHAYVSADMVAWREDGVRRYARLPQEAREFVRSFDRDEPVWPIVFTLLPEGDQT